MSSDASTLSIVWRTAGKELGFEVTAPFEFTAQGRRHLCIAYLPQFGGPNGIVLLATSPPEFDTDAEFVQDAESAGYRWSFLNIDEYRQFDSGAIREAMADWGYYGPLERTPAWLQER